MRKSVAKASKVKASSNVESSKKEKETQLLGAKKREIEKNFFLLALKSNSSFYLMDINFGRDIFSLEERGTLVSHIENVKGLINYYFFSVLTYEERKIFKVVYNKDHKIFMTRCSSIFFPFYIIYI